MLRLVLYNGQYEFHFSYWLVYVLTALYKYVNQTLSIYKRTKYECENRYLITCNVIVMHAKAAEDKYMCSQNTTSISVQYSFYHACDKNS